MAKRDIRSEDRIAAAITTAPSVLLLTLLMGVPIVTVIFMSLRNTGIGMSGGSFVGLRNFIWVFKSQDFYETLGRTAIWVFGSVSLEMVIGTSFALLLNAPFRFRPLARVIILAPYMIPTVVAVLTWTYMFNDLVGIVNYVLIKIGLISAEFQWMTSPSTAMITVIVVGVWKFTPFVVIAMLRTAILQAIPRGAI